MWRRLRPRMRLKLTREGRYFIAITIAIGLAAINTGNNLLYLVLGWMLSTIVGSGVMSTMSLRGLRTSRKPPPQIFAKRPFLMEVGLENPKRFLASFSVEVEDMAGGKTLDKKTYFLKVPPGRTQRTAYRHTFSRRGRVEFDGFRVASKFPFALFRRSRDLEAHTEVLVFPEIFPIAPMPPRARRVGETVSQRLGRQGEFFGLREYRDGDDRHDIHWRSTARAGTLMVREYEHEAQQRAAIVIDNALPDDPDEPLLERFERAVSLAASLCNTYIARGYQVRLIGRGIAVGYAAGQMQLTRILRALALLEAVPATTPFSGSPEPNTEAILVTPSGGGGRAPRHITHVLPVGANAGGAIEPIAASTWGAA